MGIRDLFGWFRREQPGPQVSEELRAYVEASAVLEPYLNFQDGPLEPIDTPARRAACVQACEQLEKYYAENPSFWLAIWTAAKGRAALGDTERALEIWCAAWEAHPERPEIVKEVSLALLRADCIAEALDINRDGTKRVPDDPVLWCNRAITEVLAGDLKMAEECLHKSLRLNSKSALSQNLQRAFVKLRQGGPLPTTLAELEQLAQ